jgi:NAD(P)-dependent dehydrogenase (short-subunit alcohol dehydrogenase family)
MGLINKLRHAWDTFFLIFVGLWITVKELDFLTWYRGQRSRIVDQAIKDAGDMTGFTCIVTGGNTGIGLEIARALAATGYRVVIGCRSKERAQEAIADIKKRNSAMSKPYNVEYMSLDVGSQKSVRAFAEEIKRKGWRINLLVNNAGVMFQPFGKTTDGIESHFAINYLGHFLLSRLLIDELARNGPSRIVSLTSATYDWVGAWFDDVNFERSTYSPFIAYVRGKLAIQMASIEMKRRLVEKGIKNVDIFTVHPGGVKTSVTRDMPGFIAWLFDKIYDILPPGMIWRTPAEGAYSAIFASLSPALRGSSDCLYFWSCQSQPFNKISLDKKSAVELWDLSEKLVSLEAY